MALKTDAELAEELRAIGWTDGQINQFYPNLLPDYGVSPYEAPSTLFDRLLMIGWSEERIREEHPEILPAEEGGILETLGEPVYTLGERAGEPVETPEPAADPGAADPGGVVIMPVGLPDEWDQGTVPDVAADQTADLMLLGLIFL